MGLYNMVFGTSNQAPLVLALLNLTPSDVGRLRDAWFEKTPSGELRLAVYTRNGSGNREHYSSENESGPSCDCTGCIITYRLPAHPDYIEDRDDSFDCTYATIWFRFPAQISAPLLALLPEELHDREKLIEKLKTIAQDPPDMGVRWKQAIESIGKPQ
jgi:hypothetical protein